MALRRGEQQSGELVRATSAGAAGATRPVRLLVCGGRDYADSRAVNDAFSQFTNHWPGWITSGLTVVTGGATGADALAAKWVEYARAHGRSQVHIEVHPADWNLYGLSAGPGRNEIMARSHLDYALVFPGGRGTADMVRRLMAHGVPFLYAGERR